MYLHKVCMHFFEVALLEIFDHFALFTCHLFPPVFKEVLVKDFLAGVIMVKHPSII